MGGRDQITAAGVTSSQPHMTTTTSAVKGSGCLSTGLPQPLLLEEKKFLLAVERGDIANVRRILQKAHRHKHINVNCMDPLGRRALTLAIDNENLEMVELLVIMGVETKDALLHAINAEFVEAVELLLEHEELIYKEGELYSWQKVDISTAMFPPDITPLILAAHKNNFEILKILLDRGTALPVPHDIRCGCEECVRMSSEDSLRHSMSRINIYRALTSPSLICLTSSDPILTAFQLSWELRNLAFTEQECKAEYMELRRQCQKFAVDLLDQTRTSNELAIILNYEPGQSTYMPGDRMCLTRLVQAIYYKQKRFVAHSNIQQLLSAIWYEGLPGFRRKTLPERVLCIAQVVVLFPFYCLIYMVAPNCKMGLLMRKPFMKFLIRASSYLFFLFILILVSQRADDNVIRLFGTERMRRRLEEEQLRQRGKAPTKLELLMLLYLVGFVWEGAQEIYNMGLTNYLRNLWNFIDFLRNSLYVSVVCLRTFAYVQQANEIALDPQMAYVPREKWYDFDPQLIAEGLFAAANVFSTLKLVHMFSINPHLGPLQISLGRMVIDIIKFFFIYSLVLFAFACGLNQLLWYFADLEKSKCYRLPGGAADWAGHADSCLKWRRFGNLFESSQSLFWASFGMVGFEDFELTGIKSYTRFWGLLMFGSYSVINVIVLLNLLIAMMSNSYAMIDEDSDTEWKFARTKLWMSYFESYSTLPPPFNIMPSAKWLIRLFRKSRKEMDRKRSELRRNDEEENVYETIMRSLVWRYVSAQHRKFEDNPVTEDDINEVKSEISTMRYEMLEIFGGNATNVSSTTKKEKQCRAKKTKVWERQLMRDFHVAPVQTANDKEFNGSVNGEGEITEIRIEKAEPSLEDETPRERFKRVARLVAAQTTSHRWSSVLQGVAQNSQIGHSKRESYKNLQHLGKAIEEAKKLILLSPSRRIDRTSPIPIEFVDEKTSTLLELLNGISEELGSSSSGPLSAKANLLEAKRRFLKRKPTTAPPPLTTRSRTLPEIQRPQVAALKSAFNFKSSPFCGHKLNKTKSNELILSATNLVLSQKVDSNKSTAPGRVVPKVPKAPTSTPLPFSVELNLCGRRPGPKPLSRDVSGDSLDITMVDRNEGCPSGSGLDELSEVSSTQVSTNELSEEGAEQKTDPIRSRPSSNADDQWWI